MTILSFSFTLPITLRETLSLDAMTCVNVNVGVFHGSQIRVSFPSGVALLYAYAWCLSKSTIFIFSS